jgi:RNA polymerase sigma-70 factor (ECF subfamily)
MNDQDEILIAQVARGDLLAFSHLVEKHKRRAYAIALGMVGTPDEAYDLSQDAFLRVYRAARKFDPARRFFPWFYAILTNLCRTHLKKRSREVAIDRIAEPFSHAAGPDEAYAGRETRRRLWGAIQRLPVSDREIVMMAHFWDYSYKEMSALLNIPIGTVMSRLYYARRKLKRELGDDFS